MTPILLQKNTTQINSELQNATDASNYYQTFLDEYNGLALSAMQPDDFAKFVENPKAFIVNVLSEGKTLKIGKLEIDPNKAFDLFPLPENTAELVAKVERIKYDPSIPHNYQYLLQHIEVTAGTRITVKQSYVDYVTENNTLYTKTEDQNTALALANKIAEDLTALKAIEKTNGGTNWLNDLFREQKNGVETTYTVNPQKIRNY